MPKVAQGEILTVHADADGRIWCLGPGPRSKVTRSALSPQEFAANLPARSTVRLLACPQNTFLLRRLGIRALESDGEFRVELGRPSEVAWGNVMPRGPGEVLVRVAPRNKVNQGYTATTCGGWRAYEASDAAHDALVLAVQRDREPEIHTALVKHPVYPYLMFVDPLDQQSLARLLVQIVDPRYFVDPEHPDRTKRLRLFLGLTADHLPTQGPAGLRASLVRKSWDCTLTDLAPPGRFVLRCWHQKLESQPKTIATSKALAKADCEASRLFVEYLRLCWLDAVSYRGYARSRRFHGPFVPEHFFRDEPATAAAQRAWLAAQG